MNMNDNLYEALKTISERRKSVREFSDAPVSDDDIRKILDIAATSPYASGRGNWGIETIRDNAVIHAAADAVDRTCADIQSRMKGGYGDRFSEYARNFSFFKSAPVLLVTYFRISPSVSIMMDSPDESVLTWERDNFIKSISCVNMLILLAAESLSLGACCVTGALVAEKELCDILRIKNGRNIGALIPIGHLKENI